MSDRCRTCRAEIVWAITVPGDKTMPLDAAEVMAGSAGALVVAQGAGGRAYAYSPGELAERIAKRQGISLQRAQHTVAADYPWHISHFSTCPNADFHRRSH